MPTDCASKRFFLEHPKSTSLSLTGLTYLDLLIKAGQQLGIITNPITNQQMPIVSPYDGQILGMALNQVTIPGYAAYHIGIKVDKPGYIEGPSEHVAAKTEMLDYSDGEE